MYNYYKGVKMQRHKIKLLSILLTLSVIINMLLFFVLFKLTYNSISLSGTWKCSIDTDYYIELFIDNNGNFYEAYISDNEIRQIQKGYIDENTMIFTGRRIIDGTEEYEYLSDVPNEMYEKVGFFYIINRTSSNTFNLVHANGTVTSYNFIREK